MSSLEHARRKHANTRKPPDLYMPAMPPLEALDAIANRFRVWMKACFQRRLAPLSGHEDHALGGFGHSRKGIR